MRQLAKRKKNCFKKPEIMKTVKFGIIGCGLMGREFASATARWCHLPVMDIRPELVAICNRTLSPEKIDWFTDNFPSIKQVTNRKAGSYLSFLEVLLYGKINTKCFFYCYAIMLAG